MQLIINDNDFFVVIVFEEYGLDRFQNDFIVANVVIQRRAVIFNLPGSAKVAGIFKMTGTEFSCFEDKFLAFIFPPDYSGEPYHSLGL